MLGTKSLSNFKGAALELKGGNCHSHTLIKSKAKPVHNQGYVPAN